MHTVQNLSGSDRKTGLLIKHILPYAFTALLIMLFLITDSSTVLKAQTPGTSNYNFPVGHQITLISNPAGGTPPYHVQWYSGSSATCSSASDTAISGATSSTYTFTPTTVASTYYCYQVVDSATAPVTTWSTSDRINIYSVLIADPPTPQLSTINLGSSITLVSNARGGTPPYTYQWYNNPSSSDCLSGTLIPGATSPTLTISPAANTHYCYWVYDSSAPQESINSTSALVIVKQPPPLPLCTCGQQEYSCSTSGTSSPLCSGGCPANCPAVYTSCGYTGHLGHGIVADDVGGSAATCTVPSPPSLYIQTNPTTVGNSDLITATSYSADDNVQIFVCPATITTGGAGSHGVQTQVQPVFAVTSGGGGGTSPSTCTASASGIGRAQTDASLLSIGSYYVYAYDTNVQLSSQTQTLYVNSQPPLPPCNVGTSANCNTGAPNYFTGSSSCISTTPAQSGGCYPGKGNGACNYLCSGIVQASSQQCKVNAQAIAQGFVLTLSLPALLALGVGLGGGGIVLLGGIIAVLLGFIPLIAILILFGAANALLSGIAAAIVGGASSIGGVALPALPAWCL